MRLWQGFSTAREELFSGVWLEGVSCLPVIHQIARIGYDRFSDLLYDWNCWQGHC
jgi:hypothetical protein